MTTPALSEAIAAELSKSFQLRQVSCLGLEAKHVTPSLPPDPSFGWDIPKTRLVWELQDEALQVIAPVSVFIEAKSESSGKAVRLADISVVLRAEYALSNDRKPLDESKVQHYVGICTFLHLWPYLRADVQWLTTKLGLPPLVLPVIVSGHAAEQVIVSRLKDVQAEPAPRKKRTLKSGTRAKKSHD
jgi:hypothetical protein